MHQQQLVAARAAASAAHDTQMPTLQEASSLFASNGFAPKQ
jgi:hypothetical protein